METLLHSCIEVRELIELSFGVVSGWVPGVDILNEGPRDSRGRSDFRVVCPIGPMVSMA